jgi:lambda repressor-like predicted transcriptional regulator
MAGSISLEPEKLRFEIARRGWQAVDLAREARLSLPTISCALQGRILKATTVVKIAKALSGTPPMEEVDALLRD